MVDKTPPPDERAIAARLPTGSSDTFDVLSERRRRYVLRFLMDRPDDGATLEELVDQLEVWEREVDENVPKDHRERIRAHLHHVDLPVLVDAGVVEYDPRSRAVRYHGDDVHEAVLELLATMESRDG